MAMNGDSLGDEMIAAIDAAVANADEPGEARTAAFRAIGNAIVAHIIANSQITFRTTDGGIQQHAGLGPSPTTPPLAPVTLLPGQIS